MTSNDILKLHRLRKTQARQALVECLMDSSLPLSENDIKEQMGPLYDRITFYRNIQTMMEAGVLHRIVAENTCIRYALNACTAQGHVHKEDHVHFYCTKCERVECLKDLPIPPISLPDGYDETCCSVIIKGICKHCSANKKLVK